MRAWRFHDSGNMESLSLDEVPDPVPGPGEVLVRVRYAALNPADRYLILGQYPRSGKPPFTVGRDCCGEVVEAPGSSRFKPRDAVVLLRSDIGVSAPGALAERVVIPEASLAPLPEGWSPQEGAAGPLVLLTAWQALVVKGGLQAGQTVLVTGASGGVGTAAIPLAKALDAQVVALSGSPAKWDALRALGADIVVDSALEGLEKRIKEALDGGKIDLVVENLGGPYIEKCARVVGMNGRIMVVGLLAGLTAEVTVGLLIHKCLRIEGLSVSAYTEAESQDAWEGIVGSLQESGKRPPIDATFGMEEVPAAFTRLAEGPLGKVLVAVAP